MADPITDAELEELKAGLIGVTPAGPWAAYMDRYEVRKAANFIGDQEIVAMCATGRGAGKRAAHIARCSPDKMAALLTRLDAAEALMLDLRSFVVANADDLSIGSKAVALSDRVQAHFASRNIDAEG